MPRSTFWIDRRVEDLENGYPYSEALCTKEDYVLTLEEQLSACEPFLKEGETPAECIARNRRDTDGCLSMLIAEKRKTETLEARLAEAVAALREIAHAHDTDARRLRLMAADALIRHNTIETQPGSLAFDGAAAYDAYCTADQPEDAGK